MTTPNTRRVILTIMASAAAVAAVPITVPATAEPADPIFAAIDAHTRVVDAMSAMHERMLAESPPRFDNNGDMICKMVGPDHPAAVACRACFDAEKTLITTAPTTQAGLQALAAHLRNDRYKRARDRIPGLMSPAMYLSMRDNALTIEDGWRVVIDDTVFVDWLIAKRFAEIANAG